MKYEAVMKALREFRTPPNFPANIFLLPEGGMSKIYAHIVRYRLKNCLELGSGFGATSCVMGAAAEEIGGEVTTIDLLRPAVNAEMLKAHCGLGDSLHCIVDSLGYNWWLADLIERQTQDDGTSTALFDLVFIDGAHEWQPDALAALLAVKLLRPGGWLVLDDLNFNLRMIPNWHETHGTYSDRELDCFQIERVWRLVVTQYPELGQFKITDGGRIGWCQKKVDSTPALRSRPIAAIRALIGAR